MLLARLGRPGCQVSRARAWPGAGARLSTSIPTTLRKTTETAKMAATRAHLFRPDQVAKLSKQDSAGAEFTMIYREVSAHKSYILYQVVGSLVFGLIFTGCFYKCRDSWYFKYLLGPLFVASYIYLTLNNLRYFYRVPLRIYSSPEVYKVVMHRLLPSSQPLIIDFAPQEINQVVGNTNWKHSGVAEFRLEPLERSLFLDRDSFSSTAEFAKFCTKKSSK